jgi:menaquinone-dependent protoporphyrinogen IX oxidase
MKILISYYTRTGNNRKVALLLKDAFAESKDVETVDVEEVVDLKNRKGIAAYALGGRDAAFGKPATIKDPLYQVAEYDLVIVGGPVWAWTICPAVRTYCTDHASRSPRVAFFCTMGGSGNKRAFSEMQKLCGQDPAAVLPLTDGVIHKDEVLLKSKIAEFCRKCLE